MTDALLVESLVKHYGPIRALRGIDLQVRPGEIFGFLGPNGAGKSTAIRVILDLIRPTSGHVSLDTSREVKALSRGNRQKVGLILALMFRPPLVILDEPTTGLDPLVQEEVEAILREVAADGRTVFFSSHILAEMETICSRASIVRDGEIVDVFDLAEQRRLAPRLVDVTFATPPSEDAFAVLPEGISITSRAGRTVSFQTHDGIDWLVKQIAAFEVADLSVRQPSLEELFVGYYREPGEDGNDGGAS